MESLTPFFAISTSFSVPPSCPSPLSARLPARPPLSIRLSPLSTRGHFRWSKFRPVQRCGSRSCCPNFHTSRDKHIILHSESGLHCSQHRRDSEEDVQQAPFFVGLNLNRSKFRPPEMPIFLGLDLDLPKITFFLGFDSFEIFRRI